ncbi:hypothetical protein [Pseudomonas sp. BMS12]|uniref:hypothetical protein n=1 Tax=Pseudomonas sp. BMS12 TaxID=1796033 RepID=UPI00083B73BF|nr:hypothetical protein [Pseudomonas sp. BMS12]
MNNKTNRYLAGLALGLLASGAQAEYWTVDEQVKNFNDVSAHLLRGDLQAAEAKLQSISQNIDKSDVRIGQYHRELANAYLEQGRQQLASGNTEAAATTLTQGEQHLIAASPALKAQYQSSLEAATVERRQAEAKAAAQAKAAQARQEAERARQQQLAEAKAAAERQARAQQQAAAAKTEPSAAPVPVAAVKPAVVAAPRARLIDPNATSSSVPMPMLDAGDRDGLRDLLDVVAADVVAFDCAVRLEVREAKDYPFVAALLSARIKKLAPGFDPQFSPVLKPDQEPRLVLSPQSNG